MKYTATIIEDKKGMVHIRISTNGPSTGGAARVIKILTGDDEQDLKNRAQIIATGKPLPDWELGNTSQVMAGQPQKNDSGFYVAYFYLTKDGRDIRIRYDSQPADDELKVVDVMNDPDARSLQLRARRYRLALLRQHGITAGPRLP